MACAATRISPNRLGVKGERQLNSSAMLASIRAPLPAITMTTRAFAADWRVDGQPTRAGRWRRSEEASLSEPSVSQVEQGRKGGCVNDHENGDALPKMASASWARRRKADEAIMVVLRSLG